MTWIQQMETGKVTQLRNGEPHQIDEALEHHELIKVRINAADKKERENLIEEITSKTGANQVVNIGHVAGFYRQAEKTKVVLPKD